MPQLHRPAPNFDRSVLVEHGLIDSDPCEIDPDLLPSVPDVPRYREIEVPMFINGVRYMVTKTVIVSTRNPNTSPTRKVQS